MKESEKEQRLVRDLGDLYHVEGRDSQFFARLYTRLEERAARLPHDTGEAQHRFNREPSLPIKAHQGNRIPFGLTQKSTWQHRLSTLAAAVFVTVLVGSLVIVFTLSHHQNSNASHVALQAIGTLSSLHMMNAQTGWALTDKAHLVRTRDGGIHWKDVSPQALLAAAPASVVTDFLTDSFAWVAFPGNDDSTTRIFRSNDGGQTWQDTTLPTATVAQMTFIDPQTGWMLSKHAVSESAETLEIFHTGDGGKTWTPIATVLASSLDGPAAGHLPFGGNKTGMSFLNTLSGWTAGSFSVHGSLLLYKTNDGGATWYPQSLTLTPDEQSALLSITPPRFFTATDGIMLVSAQTENRSSLNFYVTHNGGASWQRTTSLLAVATASDFVDINHGWASDGTHIYATQDGGQQWMQPSSQRSLHGVSHLDFVSSETGWAIGSLQTSGPSLLKTADGGRTWTVIPWVTV
jgi:photosystem II stability/assembly factor-like uncharacterized protein